MSIAKTGMEQEATEKVGAIKRQKLKEKLLRSLESPKSIVSSNVSTEDILHEIRQRELNRLIASKRDKLVS